MKSAEKHGANTEMTFVMRAGNDEATSEAERVAAKQTVNFVKTVVKHGANIVTKPVGVSIAVIIAVIITAIM